MEQGFCKGYGTKRVLVVCIRKPYQNDINWKQIQDTKSPLIAVYNKSRWTLKGCMVTVTSCRNLMGCSRTQHLLLEKLKYSYFLNQQPFVPESRAISAFLGGQKGLCLKNKTPFQKWPNSSSWTGLEKRDWGRQEEDYWPDYCWLINL